MTKQEIDEIRKRCEAATPGPWRYDGMHSEITSPCAEGYWILVSDCRSAPDDANFDFIAHARTDLPKLLEAYADLEDRYRNCLSHQPKAAGAFVDEYTPESKEMGREEKQQKGAKR